MGEILGALFAADFATNLGVGFEDVRAPMTLTFVRNGALKVEPTLDIESDAAIALASAITLGLPRMRVWRDNVLIVNAPWAPMVEDAEDGEQTTGTLKGSFRGPFALHEQRFTAASRVFTATDAGTIAWTLLSESQSTYGDTGIVMGTIEATVARDRTFGDKQVAEAVSQLTGVMGGFDFEVTPLDSGATIGQFNVYAHQGTDKSTGDQAVVFEYGPGTIGNVQKVTRQTQSPLNRVRMLGANGLRSEQFDAASEAKYNTFMSVEQAVDVSEQATLDAKALGLLRPDLIRVSEFTPDPEIAPQPWDDFWLGDTVRYRARHGSLQLDIAVRINGITLQIDEDGNVASTSLTIDQAT